MRLACHPPSLNVVQALHLLGLSRLVAPSSSGALPEAPEGGTHTTSPPRLGSDGEDWERSVTESDNRQIYSVVNRKIYGAEKSSPVAA